MPPAISTGNSIKNRLVEAGIKRAAVIDDTFDPPEANALTSEIEEFCNHAQRNPDMESELESLGVSIDFPENIGQEEIAALWELRDSGRRLAEIANEIIFARKLQDIDYIESIVDVLESLELDVFRQGVDDPLPACSVNLVFLDYYFGPMNDESSRRRAKEAATEIYNKDVNSDDKPFIVLMSSANVGASEVDRFRDETGLLGGLFEFVTKNDLSNRLILEVMLSAWAVGLPIRHEIQASVDSLESALHSVIGEFMKKVKGLNIEDYAFIQALSLQPEAQPLGEYRQWLYGSLLVNMVLESDAGSIKHRKVLDEISFPALLPSQKAPTNGFAEIYSIAIAEPMSEGIIFHCYDGDRGGAVLIPTLRLGDLLIKEGEDNLYVVVTPDCDLAFSPDGGRTPDLEQSIVMVQGTKCRLNDRRKGDLRTELFYFQDNQYRIYWDPKKVVSLRIREFHKWYKDNGHSRPARLRSRHALQIQQAFAADLGRIGMPVVPPLPESIDVEFYGDTRSGWDSLRSPLVSAATIFQMRDGSQKVVLSVECARTLVKLIDGLIQMYTDSGQAGRKIDRLEDCRKESEKLFNVSAIERALPNPGRMTHLVDTAVGLHRNGDFEGECRNGHLICLNILYEN